MKTNQIRVCTTFFLALLNAVLVEAATAAEKAVPLATFSKLPVKEITVFKDGHAFVAHEGEMPTDEKGNVVMDYLPTPVVGTFWPYSADKHVRLASVVASEKRVLVKHTALNLRELFEANIGADALISETGTNRYEATIVGLPERSAEELAATSPPTAAERLPEKGNLVLLKTSEGIKALAFDRIQEITFKGEHKPAVQNEEFRDLLTLNLDWGRSHPAKSARVGLFYLQKGVRWIPSYKVEIDGQGHASVKLNATLINELTDLEDVAVNLVVGVPTFAFKDTIDPMALQQNLAQLSQYFRNDNYNNYNGSPIATQFANSIMSQTQSISPYQGGGSPGGGSLGPDIGDATQSEDLFVFTVPHVSLKRGERIVIPVAEFPLNYCDVYTLDLPFSPPPELRGNFGSEQQRELARLFNAPKVMHKIRMENNSKYPLTTAPALLIRDGHVLAQAMMTYTAVGGSVDLPVTTAVEFQAKKSDLETKRTPNALHENGNTYSQIELAGKITVTSHHAKTAELEITRYVLGTADTADNDGKVEKLNSFEDGEFLPAGDYPYWWGWYNWPYWWTHVNGVSRITWKVKLESERKLDLAYTWHYFWQ